MWALLGTLLLCCVAILVFPIFIIRPFVHQSALPLSLALIVKRWAPWFTFLAFLAGAVLMVRAWARRGERLRILKNAVMLAAVTALGLSVWASRINIYEHMFAPASNVRFITAGQASLRPGDMVIAVNINGAARAYPVLQMAYHHVLNDVVGGVPIVSTY
jgi:Protein of unknown function (DUF3179)